MNKRKLMLVAVALCMAAILLAGGTLAYLTDTDAQTNVFTMGKVGLELDEGKITTSNDGKWESTDVNNRTSDNQTYKVFPGDVVTKDPTIHLDEDSEDAWVAAKMVITGNLYSLMGVEGYNNLDVHTIISGGEVAKTGVGYTTWNGLFCYETATAYIHQKVVTVDTDDAEGVWEIYVFMKDRIQPGTDICLFDTVTIPTAWDNEEAALFNNAKVEISAYAVQEDGFDDAYAAMTTAFKDVFVFN